MNTAINWGLALFLAIILAIGTAFSPEDKGHEWSESKQIASAEKEALLHHQIEQKAFEICRELQGESGFAWTAEGKLVCIPRHGKRQLISNP